MGCPIPLGRDGRFTVEFTDQEHRIAGRRREHETGVFAERYTIRAGIESTSSGPNARWVWGNFVSVEARVFSGPSCIKIAGWKILRAAVPEEIRALAATAMIRILRLTGSAQVGQVSACDLGLSELLRAASNAILSRKKPAARWQVEPHRDLYAESRRPSHCGRR
jgi:hypothetical protein